MEAPLLKIRDLSVSFQSGKTTIKAVDGVGFDIKGGETVALVGESGSGKTITGLSIIGLVPSPPAQYHSGSILFAGQELLGLSERHYQKIRGNKISVIFQEPMTSLNPLHVVGRQISEIILTHRAISREAAQKQTIELLERVQIKNPQSYLHTYPHQLSGGQRQRVMIAMALANAPDLLIADEPTTALDVTIQTEILTLLQNLQKDFGTAILLITHNLDIVARMADRVNVMRQGKIVESGVAKEVFGQPRHAYTKMLVNARPCGKAEAVPDKAQEILTIEDVKIWFPIKQGILRRIVGHVKAVDGISFQLREGQTIGIVGESGSGKTTLGLAILRLIASTGRICYLGRDLQGLRFSHLRPLRREMQIVFQDPYGSLSPRLSVGEIIAEGLDIHQPAQNEQATKTANHPGAGRGWFGGRNARTLSA